MIGVCKEGKQMIKFSELIMILGNILIIFGVYLIHLPTSIILAGVSLIAWGFLLLKASITIQTHSTTNRKGGDD